MAAELLLVFIHREADVSPAEGQQGSSGTGGLSARQPTPQTFADLNTQHVRMSTATFSNQFIGRFGQFSHILHMMGQCNAIPLFLFLIFHS